MEKFLIQGKRNISLFEFWGGLGNHYQALIALGYIVRPDKHYLYYEDRFNVDAYKNIHGEWSMPRYLISNKVNLKNISLARYSTDGVLIWKHMDVMSICDNNNFYKKGNHKQIIRLVEECKVKFLVFESKYFQEDETKKFNILKDFLRKMSRLGYIVKEVSLDNYEYFSLLKQKKPYFICYLPKYVSFKLPLLEKKVQRHTFFGLKGNIPFRNINLDKMCKLRIYRQKLLSQYNTVKEFKNHFTYTPLDKNEIPSIFRPKGLHSHQINKINKYINEVTKWSSQDKKEIYYMRPKIGRYSNGRKSEKWLSVTEVPVRELLLQYGFFSEAAYKQELGHNKNLRLYIKDDENEQKIIKSLANSSSVNVLKYIYAGIFIYISKKEVSYAKEHRW